MEKTCENCKYEDRNEDEQPCRSCIHSAVERFEPKETLWIPIKHKLPRQNELVLITYINGYYANNPILVGVGFHKNGRWMLKDSIDYIDVIAWQPFPEPYKVGE